jgi:hypothetical protein
VHGQRRMKRRNGVDRQLGRLPKDGLVPLNTGNSLGPGGPNYELFIPLKARLNKVELLCGFRPPKRCRPMTSGVVEDVEFGCRGFGEVAAFFSLLHHSNHTLC